MAVIGMITDSHYNRQIQYGSRYCPDSLVKLQAALAVFRTAGVDLVINLGDSLDCHGLMHLDEDSLADLQELLASASVPVYSVMGNHDLELLDKAHFCRAFALPSLFPLSFNHGNCHIILLDAAFSEDGQDTCGPQWDWRDSWIPAEQIAWLQADLAASTHPFNLVCVHQNLDIRATEGPEDPHCIRNAAAVRTVLQDSGRRIIVLQGHYHPGMRQLQQGIPYLTLRAMCEGSGLENNAFAILRTGDDGTACFTGYAQQDSLVVFDDC